MKKVTHIFALIAAIGSASCFSVDLTGAVFACDPTQSGECPDGQTCSPSQKICVAGELPDLATDGSASLLIPAEGCPLVGGSSGMGFDVTASGKSKVYACPVKFSNQSGKTADVQCRAPYTLCSSGVNVDLTACSKAGQFMGGYFISSVAANRKLAGNMLSCGASSGGTIIPAWAGCGRTASAVSCQGFTSAQECLFQGGNFQCQGTKISDVVNSDGTSGVLCCKP